MFLLSVISINNPPPLHGEYETNPPARARRLHAARPRSSPTKPRQPLHPCVPTHPPPPAAVSGCGGQEPLEGRWEPPSSCFASPEVGRESQGGRASGKELAQKLQKRISGATGGGTWVGRKHRAWRALSTHGWESSLRPHRASHRCGV